jgi:hypothetical protein
MRWKIDPKGMVSGVVADTARSQIAEPGLVACVTDVLKAIRFAASPRGFETSASYPFNFHPKPAQRIPAAQ